MKNEMLKRQIRNINSELPFPIMEVIFLKLPLFNLPNCRIVCKKWNKLILTSRFNTQISISSIFYNRSWIPVGQSSGILVCVEFDPNPSRELCSVASFNFDPKFVDFSILHSCNGLICFITECYFLSFRNPRPEFLYILNPMTNEYRKLQISKADRGKDYIYGLGFSPKTKQFKLARASVPGDVFGTLIEILAFGKGRKWTTVGYLPSSLNLINFVYSNGGLYLGTDFMDRVIYRLDVENETIGEVSCPTDEGMFHRMVDLDGILYLTLFSYDHFHVWKLSEDFSWIQVIVFDRPSPKSFDFELFKVYEDGKILCKYESDFVLYDPMSNMKNILADKYGRITVMESFHQIGVSHFNSLRKILAGNG